MIWSGVMGQDYSLSTDMRESESVAGLDARQRWVIRLANGAEEMGAEMTGFVAIRESNLRFSNSHVGCELLILRGYRMKDPMKKMWVIVGESDRGKSA